MTAAPSQSIASALSLLAMPGTGILAGGTDWYPALGDRSPPARVVDVMRIAGFDELLHGESGTRIGAGVTWTRIIDEPLPGAFDALKAAAREVGSVQIQNTATLVGNLCNASPAADGVPALLALDAEVELVSGRGLRRLPLSDFITGVRQTARREDELVSAIRVPVQADGTVARFAKLGSRRYLVISIVMIAVVLQPDATGRIIKARVAVGACSPVACRLKTLEERLVGRTIDDVELADCVTGDCLDVLSPIDDVRGSGAYRFAAVAELLKRLLVPGATRDDRGIDGRVA